MKQVLTPVPRGEIGVLMKKGQDDLLQLVNAAIRQMKSDGTLRRLHQKYGLSYAYDSEDACLFLNDFNSP